MSYTKCILVFVENDVKSIGNNIERKMIFQKDSALAHFVH